MFDKEIALDSLQKIMAILDLITERASVVETPNDFLCSPGGMMRLDAIGDIPAMIPVVEKIISDLQ